jgi:hypothetical protein
MNARKLRLAKLGEWVFGSTMAWGVIAPSAALSDLLGGQSGPCCGGAQFVECIWQNGSACLGGPTGNNMFAGRFCSCFGGPGGICTTFNSPCVAPCFAPPGSNPGRCNINTNCYY